jgi:hypothetical protein
LQSPPPFISEEVIIVFPIIPGCPNAFPYPPIGYVGCCHYVIIDEGPPKGLYVPALTYGNFEYDVFSVPKSPLKLSI